MERLRPITFASAGSHPVQLEGIFHTREQAGSCPAAVVCHPHPLGGGTMHNAVVTAIARSLSAKGAAVLRFNFRGVGQSGGWHDNGRGEQADVEGALNWLLEQERIDAQRLFVVGYSFGAWVGLTVAERDRRVAAVASAGLVAWHYDAEFFRASARPDLGVDDWQLDVDFLGSFAGPKLFVTGERDSLAPPGRLERLVERLPGVKVLHVLPGADHSYRGHERRIGALVAQFLTDTPAASSTTEAPTELR